MNILMSLSTSSLPELGVYANASLNGKKSETFLREPLLRRFAIVVWIDASCSSIRSSGEGSLER